MARKEFCNEPDCACMQCINTRTCENGCIRCKDCSKLKLRCGDTFVTSIKSMLNVYIILEDNKKVERDKEMIKINHLTSEHNEVCPYCRIDYNKITDNGKIIKIEWINICELTGNECINQKLIKVKSCQENKKRKNQK